LVHVTGRLQTLDFHIAFSGRSFPPGTAFGLEDLLPTISTTQQGAISMTRIPGTLSQTGEDLAAELAEAVYHVILGYGIPGAFLDVELGLWHALRSVLRNWGGDVPVSLGELPEEKPATTLGHPRAAGHQELVPCAV
jgi:hypothetical protein